MATAYVTMDGVVQLVISEVSSCQKVNSSNLKASIYIACLLSQTDIMRLHSCVIDIIVYCIAVSCSRCIHGRCIAQNQCLCDNGWDGPACDTLSELF